MNKPSRKTTAGAAYLDLQRMAKADARATDELLTLCALEGFLDRLSTAPQATDLILKGGVLLAAYETRRPTRDVDLQATDLNNDANVVLALICDIAASDGDDGLFYDTSAATSATRDVNGDELAASIAVVAAHRQATLIPLDEALAGYEEIAQVKWHSWVRKQRLTDRVPEDFGTVLDDVLTFAGPVLNPATRPARAGMAFGRVRRSWAAEHHRAWHDDLEQTARSPR